MGESVNVFQCPFCLFAHYATGTVDHDWFYIGEVLRYAQPEVCPRCALEQAQRTEKQAQEIVEHDRAMCVVPEMAGNKRVGAVLALAVPPFADWCGSAASGVRMVRKSPEVPP